MQKTDKKSVFVLIVIGAIMGSAIMAYNADDMYLSTRDNVVVALPERMVSGYETSLIATAADSSGEPAAGEGVVVTLKTADEEYELYTGKTDSSGTAQPSFTVPKYSGVGTLVVEVGGEKLSRGVVVEDSESGDFTTKILITTDKPIYQPDQTVHIRTLTYEGVELSASERDITMEIQDADGNKIFRKTYSPDEYGIASLDYALSDQLPLGNYKISATVGNKTEEKTILVKDYVLPKFRIDLLDTKTWYTVDEYIDGRVSAIYFFGKDVEGTATVEAYVYRGLWDKVATRTGTLANGEFEFSIPPSQYAVGLDLNSGNGLLELNLTVVDTGGHEEYESHFITLAAEPIQITTLSDTNVRGADSTYYIITRYPNGVPVDNAIVHVYIESESYDLKTDDRGITSVTFPYTGQNTMKITAQKGGESVTKYITIEASDGIKIVSNEAVYDIGDTASFSVHYSGRGATKYVYYDVISEGFVIKTGRVKLSDGEAQFEIPITPDMSPAASIRVYKIEQDLDVVRDSVLILVSSPEELDVDITTDKGTYRPNEDVTVYFHVSDAEGQVLSALGISAVDMSVFEVSERFQGFEDVFWGLEEEFITPQYQIVNYVYSPTPQPLPVEPGEDVISKGGDEGDVWVLSTWPAAKEDAENVRNEWVDNYWGAVILLVILGYFALFAVAIKYKAAAVVGIFLIVLVAFVIAAVLYASVQSIPSAAPGLDREHDDQVFDAETEEEGGAPVAQKDESPAPAGFNFRWDMDAEDADSDGLADSGNGPSQEPPTHVRTYFPETWYWNPALITDENGYAFVTLTTPDSITSWGIEAIASTKDARLGTGEANVTVFQEFFVEPDIPVSVVRGDEFPLRVLVYNYDSVESNITIELASDPWFTLLSESVQYALVDAQSVSSVDFVIRAEKVGDHNITIDASTPTLADKVVKEMTVVPDGKKEETVENGQLDNDMSVDVVIELDSDRVENSENAFVKLQGGMEAVALDGAENYIHFVSGCGEQSMSTLSIDILAYATVQDMDGTVEKLFEYETMVNQGIQHELTFLLPGNNGVGRGIVWFPYDQDVHPWLTSWGLITFQDAIDAGLNLDEDIITDMQDWLVSQQNADGSYEFPDWGIYETNNPILKAKKVATTAYITRALLYSGYDPAASAVSKALNYIDSHISEHWDDSYTLALSLIALEDGSGDATLGNDIAARLEALKEEENGTVYWTSDTNMISDGDNFFGWGYRSSPRTIETTGYAIMALHKHGGHSATVNAAVNYLLTHRSGLGGFFSTQDTVVAFQALAGIGEIDIEELEVTVEADGVEIDTITFTEDNKDLTYLIDLRPYLAETTTVTLTSSGEGSVLYQVYSSQYIPWNITGVNEPQEMTLDVSYSATNISVDDKITATLTLEYLGSAAMLKMVLVDLRAPVGFSFIEDNFANLVSWGRISNYEINDRECMVYIEDIYPETPITLTYNLLANKPIKGVVQGIHAYDMYNPDLDVEIEPVEIIAS